MENRTIVLCNNEGKEVIFDILGYVTYCGIEYVVLYPVEEDSGEVLILEVGENQSYLGIDDDDLIEAIFNLFKEEYRDEYEFDGEETGEFDIEIEEEIDPESLN